MGAQAVGALGAGGHEPVVLDTQTPRVDVEYVRGDVRDDDAVRGALRGCELVCHQAAKVGLGVDLDDMPAYASHNDLGTAVLLGAIAHTRPRRLVLASSMVVYGEGRYRCREHGLLPRPPPPETGLPPRPFQPARPH